MEAHNLVWYFLKTNIANDCHSAVLAVPGVIFCGYRVPHPLEPRTVIKIQTDGALTPVQALKAGCERVIAQVGAVRSSWKHECQMLGAGIGPAAAAAAAAQAAASAQAPPQGLGGTVAQANGAYTFGSSNFGEQRGADVGGYVDI